MIESDRKDNEKIKICQKLRAEGKTIEEICKITGLRKRTVENYSAGYCPVDADLSAKARGFGYELLVDWTNTVNIGRKKLGLPPFPIPYPGQIGGKE